MGYWSTAVTLSLFTVAAAAQQTKVIPPSAATTDGNFRSDHPFAFRTDSSRTQQVIDGGSIAKTSARITEVAFRRDATNRTDYAGGTVRLDVSVGYATTSAAGMSTRFANNRKGVQTVVLSGNYRLPPIPAVTGGPAPWSIAFKLAKPFLYRRTGGALLIEIAMLGVVREYHVDAERAGSAGFSEAFGQSGSFANGQRWHTFYAPAPELIKPGGTLTLQVTNLRFGPPAVLLLGGSQHRWGAIPLPLDFGPIGAKGNHLYVRPDVATPLAIVQQGGSWGATVRTPLPNIAALAGQTWFAQPFFVHQPSNTLGIVVANAISFTFGGGTSATNAVASRSSSAASGSFVFGPQGRGGPVVLLRGAFN